jgi:L-amino acid N-acyltransferase YncA
MMIDIEDATEADLPAMLAINNLAVVETTASWNHKPADLASRQNWFAGTAAKGDPVLVARRRREGGGGEVVGYAYWGPFRPSDGYLHTVENSVYVRKDCQGQGVGRLLMVALIERARAHGLHAIVAGIGAENTGSIALHARLGFIEYGRMPQVGAKFGRWLDLVLMQLMLNEDERPPG